MVSRGRRAYQEMMADAESEDEFFPDGEGYEVYAYAASAAFEEPGRGELRARPLPRLLSEELAECAPDPGRSKDIPRI